MTIEISDEAWTVLQEMRDPDCTTDTEAILGMHDTIGVMVAHIAALRVKEKSLEDVAEAARAYLHAVRIRLDWNLRQIVDDEDGRLDDALAKLEESP